MADTGFLSPTAYEDSANTAFTSQWITSGVGLIAFVANTGTQTVKDFSTGTISGTVNGAKVFLYDTFGISHADAALNIQISIDDGSSFSTAKSTGALGTDDGSGNDVDPLGGSTDLWGLNWSGFTDLDQLKVKGTEHGGQVVVSDYVQIKVYYTPSGYGSDVMGVASANIGSLNGIATATISKVNGV